MPRIPQWDIEAETGYKPITTFWQDFSIADRHGAAAVKDTFRRAFKEWRDDYKFITELSLVLNHKIWQHYEDDEPLARVYDTLWRTLDDWCYDHFDKEEKEYYFSVTD